jgi:hypothetical protein
VGLLLITAAVLKMLGTSAQPYATFGWLHTPGAQSLIVLGELILGIWLISGLVVGTGRWVAWVCAVGTFATFASVSATLGFLGQANCGCFGSFEASPWLAFTVDIVVLALLVSTKPYFGSWNQQKPVVRLVGCTLGVAGLILVSCILAFGDIETALAKLRGLPFQTTPAILDFGSATAGTLQDRQLTVKNYKSVPLRLIGGTSDCSCLATQDLPISIPSQGQADVTIRLRFPAGTSGEMARLVELYTDDSMQPKISLRAVARITAVDVPPSEPK